MGGDLLLKVYLTQYKAYWNFRKQLEFLVVFSVLTHALPEVRGDTPIDCSSSKSKTTVDLKIQSNIM